MDRDVALTRQSSEVYIPPDAANSGAHPMNGTDVERRDRLRRGLRVCTQIDMQSDAQQMMGAHWERISLGDGATARSPAGWGQGRE